MSGTLPNFLIIGAQKSGTTSLYNHLHAHPDVFCAQGKEIHYFDRLPSKAREYYKIARRAVTTENQGIAKGFGAREITDGICS